MRTAKKSTLGGAPGSGWGVQDQDPNVQFSERISSVGFGQAPADSAALPAASRFACADWRLGERASTVVTACSTVIVAGEPGGTAWEGGGAGAPAAARVTATRRVLSM